ncbi:DUF5723 family protein [Hymenobacter sp. BT559]|uniref:DUF5723 family protein n=1 Tax=Hymenobacter sp. BT559 TaxID=2795729 RepID=UPI0018EC2C53|nr:DUF5723 family protein [Hymenobacter sp. BT559]MBJ6141747.1 hypothetical protein [Hymenobacter sp. BT559]
MTSYFTLLPGVRAGILLVGLLAAQPAAAQGWLGLAQSNYGGTNNVYLNPSTIADARHRAYLNLGGGGANFYNTYVQLDLPQRPWAQGFQFQREYLSEQLTGDAKFGSASIEARLPSLMLTLGPRSAIALTNRVRAFVQFSNVSENLARLAYQGLGDAEDLGLADRVLTDNGFNIDANSFHEFAFTYARTFTPNTTHFFKGGLTVKYLVGLGGAYLHNAGTGYQVYGSDSIQLRNPNVSYAYAGANDYYQQSGFGLGTLYGGQRLGRGYGADIGVTYEWRPYYERYHYQMDGTTLLDDSRNKYRLRLGLALTDLGAVRYQSERHVRQATLANDRVVQLGQLDTISFTNLNTLTPSIERLVGLREQSSQFTSYLPATLRLTADYRLLNHLYAGLLWTQNLLPTRTVGSRSVSSLALTPRVEFSHLEVAVPVILANNYRKLQVGAMLRLGPVIVGSDNLGGLVGLTSTTGADVYFGVGLALHRPHRKDRDGDLVSNKYDKCPREKGTWASKGCPIPAPALPPAPPALAEPSAPAPPLTEPAAVPAPAPTTP